MNILPIPVPPNLGKSLGYRGVRRYVGFYWEPAGDELMFNDYFVIAQGNGEGWMQFIRHPKVVPVIQAYDFGSSDAPAKHWLMLDRKNHVLYVGTPQEVEDYVCLNNCPSDHMPLASHVELEFAMVFATLGLGNDWLHKKIVEQKREVEGMINFLDDAKFPHRLSNN